MIAPHCNLFSKKLPQRPTKQNIFLVHMHKHHIVAFTLVPDEAVEIEKVAEARHAALFAEREHADIIGQMMFPYPECDDGHLFAMLRELRNPSMEKPEDIVVLVDFLCDDEEAH